MGFSIELAARDLIEEYRLLFIDWVAGFDKWDYVIEGGAFLIRPELDHLIKTLMMIYNFLV